MAKAAIKKKVGRPAKKAVGRPAKKVAAKRKPRVSKKKAEQSFEERMGWRFDHVSQKWTKPLEGFTLEDLRSMFSKLSVRVQIIENKIEQAEQAGEKIKADLDKWRETSAPKWKPHNGLVGKPFGISHAKVKVMLRNGEIIGPKNVDALTWSDIGDCTIIAYALV